MLAQSTAVPKTHQRSLLAPEATLCLLSLCVKLIESTQKKTQHCELNGIYLYSRATTWKPLKSSALCYVTESRY